MGEREGVFGDVPDLGNICRESDEDGAHEGENPTAEETVQDCELVEVSVSKGNTTGSGFMDRR